MKRFLYYFIWTLGTGVILYIGMQWQGNLAEKARTSFNLFPLQSFVALFPVLIGILIRTPKLVLQMKNKKSWTFDWVLFAAIGLPALYLVLMSVLPFSPLMEGWLQIPRIILLGGTTVPTIAGLVFGYTLIESFKDVNDTY